MTLAARVLSAAQSAFADAPTPDGADPIAAIRAADAANDEHEPTLDELARDIRLIEQHLAALEADHEELIRESTERLEHARLELHEARRRLSLAVEPLVSSTRTFEASTLGQRTQ